MKLSKLVVGGLVAVAGVMLYKGIDMLIPEMSWYYYVGIGAVILVVFKKQIFE